MSFQKKNINKFSSYAKNYNSSSIASGWLKANTNKKNVLNYENSDEISEFNLMERVFHQKFGYGKVAEIDGDKVTINFEKAGQKKLLLSFIEKI